MTSNQCYLTTIDNPYSPATHFREWFLYDVGKGYDSCSRLARRANTSDQLSDEENQLEIERAIDSIVKYDFTNTFMKLTILPRELKTG